MLNEEPKLINEAESSALVSKGLGQDAYRKTRKSPSVTVVRKLGTLVRLVGNCTGDLKIEERKQVVEIVEPSKSLTRNRGIPLLQIHFLSLRTR
ncbi:hypothetical protein CK203_082703 [Vitis vinifera]|uniref:Uncharacterized protein n=1 Tax=Vitis vinifera TaxID=29760 RepID=A0A438F9W9_VITVI|nr:hypothetical protein CK203_082703 [Vitis vinifera]